MQHALNMISSNSNEFFTYYEKASFNPIPIITNKERKVYVLTASQKQGTVFIGNDYLLQYNSKNELNNHLLKIPLKKCFKASEATYA